MIYGPVLLPYPLQPARLTSPHLHRSLQLIRPPTIVRAPHTLPQPIKLLLLHPLHPTILVRLPHLYAVEPTRQRMQPFTDRSLPLSAQVAINRRHFLADLNHRWLKWAASAHCSSKPHGYSQPRPRSYAQIRPVARSTPALTLTWPSL